VGLRLGAGARGGPLPLLSSTAESVSPATSSVAVSANRTAVENKRTCREANPKSATIRLRSVVLKLASTEREVASGEGGFDRTTRAGCSHVVGEDAVFNNRGRIHELYCAIL
jgi:hypothetical protein